MRVLLVLLAILIALTACSTTETIKATDVDGQCVVRNVDRAFGVTLFTTELVGDCS